MRACVYSRFSTDRQNESSIADQVRVCTEYAARQGWQIVERYDDQGISGTALGNRPGVLRMREAALARRFDALLVADLSRLARSEDLPPLIHRFRFQGVRVIGVQDGFDSQARTARMQAGMASIMGAEFVEMVRARTYAALESRAKERRPTGGRAFGYRDNAIVESEAEIVRGIFERYARGASCKAIAADLNERGIASPGATWRREIRRRAGWMESAVRAILLNERYAGIVHWNVSEWLKDPDSGRRHRRMRPRSEWITHCDAQLRIVSEDLWQRVTARRERRARAIGERVKRGIAEPSARCTGRAPKYVFSTLLQCGQCSANFVMVDKAFYGCSSFKHGGAAACTNNLRIKRTLIQDGLVRGIRTDLLAPEVVAEVERRYAKRMRGEAQQRKPGETIRRIAELETRTRDR
jgi:site-specific DNA recombinase